MGVSEICRRLRQWSPEITSRDDYGAEMGYLGVVLSDDGATPQCI